MLAGWFPAYENFGESYYLQKIGGVPIILMALSKLESVVPKYNMVVETDLESVEKVLVDRGYFVHRREFSEFMDKPHDFLLKTNRAESILSFNPIMPFIKRSTWQDLIERYREERPGLLEFSSVVPGHTLGRSPKKREAFVQYGHPFFSLSESEILTSKKLKIPKDSQYWDLDMIESVAVYNQETMWIAEGLGKTLPASSDYLFAKANSTDEPSHGDRIRLLVSDVDGVMTDAGMYYSESGDQFKKFNAKDGIGIKRLLESGREIGLLSTGVNENLIRERAKTLRIPRVAVGKYNKLETLTKWKDELGLEWAEIAFIGDDINDLTVIDHVGLFACPGDAIQEVREKSHIVLEKKGGEGCVREFIDRFILPGA